MDVELTHKLYFSASEPPTIGELFAMLKMADQQRFPENTPVYIRAGVDERDHDYYFHATIERPKGGVP